MDASLTTILEVALQQGIWAALYIYLWRATASRLLELAKPGSRMSLKGYLSQHTTANGTFVEVTVDEFCIAANSKPGRTLSNSMPPAESVAQCEATE